MAQYFDPTNLNTNDGTESQDISNTVALKAGNNLFCLNLQEVVSP